MIDNVTFGGFVRTLRKEKQMTQLELAKILNLSDKTISKWEQGRHFRTLQSGKHSQEHWM